MQQDRIADFMRETGNKRPFVEHLSLEECEQLRKTVCNRLGISVDMTGVALARALRSKQVILGGRAGGTAPLSLRTVLDDIHVVPNSHMYVNWAHFNVIDRFESKFLIQHFADLIYPGGDYPDIFDDSLAWIISVDYETRIHAFATC